MNTTSRTRRWWTEEEDQVLRKEVEFQQSQGSLHDWNRVAAELPGRTNKDCRKRWSKIPGHIKKGVWSDSEDQRLKSAVQCLGNRWTLVAQAVGTRNADQCAKRWQNSLDPSLDHSEWVPEDDARLLTAVDCYGRVWRTIGEKEFPRRSTTELKNRFIIIDRRRQLDPGGATRCTASSRTVSTAASSDPDVDMQDSEPTDSFLDGNEAEHSCQEIGFEGLVGRRSNLSTPVSRFEQQATSVQPTSGSFSPFHNVPPSTLLHDLSYPENQVTAGFQTLHEGDDLFSRPPAACLDASFDLPPQSDVHNYNLNASTWDSNPLHSSTSRRESAPVVFHSFPPKADDATAPFPSRVIECEEGMVSSETASDKTKGSTVILVHVQPQMATSTINLLYQSRSVVKMKIVSQE